MRKSLLFALILLLSVSCATFISSEGPEWTRVTPRHAGMAVFVSSGVGRDEAAARAAAYMNVLEELGTDLGYDAVSPYYRELLQTGSIASLSAFISNTYVAPANEGAVYYVMLEMPENVYYSSRDAEYSASLERTEEIGRLLSSAIERYRGNEDTKALIAVLEALDLSLSGPVLNEDYAPEALLARATEYLRNIGISVERGADGTDVSVHMRRMKGLLHPDVVNGLVEVAYPMVRGDGSMMTASAVLRTDGEGDARFFRTNPYMLWKGELRFSVHVPEELIDSIASKAFEGFLDQFLDLLESSSIVYSYEDRSEEYSEDTVIAVAEYGEDGVQLDASPAYSSFSSYLEASSAEGYLVVRGYGEEESDVLDFARRAFPSLENYVILRAGITGSTEKDDRVHVRAEARLSFYDAESENPLMVRSLATVGGGSSAEEAGTEALSSCGSAAAGMFLSVL